MSAGFHGRPSLSDCYRVLGLQPGADEAEVRTAFRKLSMKHHPDKTGVSQANNDKFAEIRLAYEDILDYHAEPKRGRWAPPPPDEVPPGGGRDDFYGAGPSRGSYERSYRRGGGGGPSGRGYDFMDNPEFEEWFDMASEFMFGEKGKFPGGSSSRRPPPSGFGFEGFPRGGSSRSSGGGGGMPRGGWSNFSPPGNPPGGRHEDWDPFSEQQGRGGDSSSGRSGYNGYGGSRGGGGGGDDDAAPPSRDDPLAVIQWSLRNAHRRLAPLPGKLAKMREWWDSVGACGDLNRKQQIVGAELFDRAELHLAKMLSEATELMDAIRQHQQRQDTGNEGKKGKGKQKEKGHWYSKLGSRKNKKTNEKGSPGSKKKKTDKWANAAAQLGRDSEAVLNELVALDMCAAHDDLDEFFAALGDIKSGAGSDNRQGTADDDDESEEEESSEDENSEDESSEESGSSSSTD
ncbi:protein DnaJ-related SCJ1 [Apiospora arundinis]